jgi:hypothetical protein
LRDAHKQAVRAKYTVVNTKTGGSRSELLFTERQTYWSGNMKY